MGSFPYLLAATFIDDEHIQLDDDLAYILDTDQANDLGMENVTATIGFVTDGASIPRPFWSLIGSPLTGKYRKAAVIHDWLCVQKMCSRKLGDQIFKRAMKDSGVGWIRRNLIYSGVRAYAIATGKT
jgi:hypothetical protein